MSSINPQIAAAAVLMKAQAAQHNETKTMDGVTFSHLLCRADYHTGMLRYALDDAHARRHLIAALNYHALALSLVPAELAARCEKEHG